MDHRAALLYKMQLQNRREDKPDERQIKEISTLFMLTSRACIVVSGSSGHNGGKWLRSEYLNF